MTFSLCLFILLTLSFPLLSLALFTFSLFRSLRALCAIYKPINFRIQLINGVGFGCANVHLSSMCAWKQHCHVSFSCDCLFLSHSFVFIFDRNFRNSTDSFHIQCVNALESCVVSNGSVSISRSNDIRQ